MLVQSLVKFLSPQRILKLHSKEHGSILLRNIRSLAFVLKHIKTTKKHQMAPYMLSEFATCHVLTVRSGFRLVLPFSTAVVAFFDKTAEIICTQFSPSLLVA